MFTRVVLLLLVSFTTVCRTGSVKDKEDENEVEDQEGRIWNGEDADANSFPFMARLRGAYRCGGSIISDRVILTAAHCIIEEEDFPAGVVLGDHESYNEESTEDDYEVDFTVIHEGYNNKTFANDIALIFLKENITFTEAIAPINLPEIDYPSRYEGGEPIIAAGWGVEEETEELSDTLRYVEHKEFLDQEKCANYWSSFGIQKGMICTQATEDKGEYAHTTGGDSGGPLFVEPRAGFFVQFAIVSWGSAETDYGNNTIDVNTDVVYYKEWILRTMEYRKNDDPIRVPFTMEWSDKYQNVGILLASDPEGVTHTVCREGMGQKEVDAICRRENYRTGTLLNIGMDRKFKSMAKDMEFGITEMSCGGNHNGNQNGNHTGNYTEFQHASHDYPGCFFKLMANSEYACMSGEEVVVACTNSPFNITFPHPAVSVKAQKPKKGNGMAVRCKVEASRYGIPLNLNHRTDAYVLLVNHTSGDYIFLETSRAKQKRNGWILTTIDRPEGNLDESCIVCLVQIKGTAAFGTGLSSGCYEYSDQEMQEKKKGVQKLLINAMAKTAKGFSSNLGK